jgi:UDP:flavonoid glycosyltransferase YjiC (YdhE family)
MKIFIPTIGTRGDVQPYVALGVGFREAGHDVTIATVNEFASFISGHGLTHGTIRGSFLDSLKPDAPKVSLRETARAAKRDAPDALCDEWEAAQGTDAVIYNPAAWGGYHIAEKLGVPGFAAFPTPLYAPTSEYPSPFLPFNELGPLNKASHRLYMKLGPAMFRKAIKAWRIDVLGLPPAKSEWQRAGEPVTRLFGYSPAIVPPSKDWDSSVVVTGYWFLEDANAWEPPADLVDFLEDGPPPVYIGFGSMVAHGKSAEMGGIVRDALRRSGQRGILTTGWGGLSADTSSDDVYVIDAVPHDWLFPRVAAVVHHGGAGTTGAGLAAGKPTIICPFITDQRFWGQRVEQLGVGPAAIPQKKLTAAKLARAIEATTDSDMIKQADTLGTTIRAEDGVGTAVRYVLDRLGS